MTIVNKNRSIICLIIGYIIFELCLIPHAALCRDEYCFGYNIYHYLSQIPYRDFAPYKTVLGYYLLSIPYLFSHDIIKPLSLIKLEIAFINAIFLFTVMIYSQKFFDKKAILLTWLIILSSQLFLITAVDLRVDMLASWMGLLSALFILSNRYYIAGLIIALGFLISQKAIWFMMATNIALFSCVWADFRIIRGIVRYNISLIIIISLYVLYWAHVSSISAVLHSIFIEAYTLSKMDWYQGVYFSGWRASLSFGPLLFLLWPLTWLMLEKKNISFKNLFILVYASSIILLMISYKQSFLYNFLLCMPGFSLLYAEFFTWVFKNSNYYFNQKKLFLVIALNVLLIVSIIYLFNLTKGYYLILFIPIVLGFMLYHDLQNKNVYLFMAIIIITGIVYPLISSFNTILYYYKVGPYQQSVIRLANSLLKDGESYFAGILLLYNKDESIPGLKNLVYPQLEYINQPSPHLQPWLVSSLYLQPRTAAEILQDLKQKPVKFYVNNIKIQGLPNEIQQYLSKQYQHFWGGIYLYAPQIVSTEHFFQIKFDGEYQIQKQSGENIYIDNHLANQTIHLRKGMHLSKSQHAYRLKLIPKLATKDLDANYQNDEWWRLTFDMVKGRGSKLNTEQVVF